MSLLSHFVRLMLIIELMVMPPTPQHVLVYNGVILPALVTALHKPSAVLTKENFNNVPFSSNLTNDHSTRKYLKKINKYLIAQVEAKYNDEVLKVFALQVSEIGEEAFWVPENGYVDIPAKPKPDDPQYVFTKNTGNTVESLDKYHLRIQNVKMKAGLPVSDVGGFEYLRFSQDEWKLHIQTLAGESILHYQTFDSSRLAKDSITPHPIDNHIQTEFKESP